MSDETKGYARIAGRVLDTTNRSGVAKSGQPYSLDFVSVLTGKAVTELRWDQETCGPVPKEDDVVLVEAALSVYGGRLSVDAYKRLPLPGTGVRAAAS